MTTGEVKARPAGLTGLAIRNHVVVLVVVGLLAVSGVFSYLGMPKQQDPGFVIRAAVITTNFPGASPSRVEELVTDQIEKALQDIPEIDHVTSESRNGLSIVTVNFQEKYKDMQPLFNRVRRKMDDLQNRGALPAGAAPPVVNDEYGDVFGLLYTLHGEGFSYKELDDIAKAVRTDMLAIDNVAKVVITAHRRNEFMSNMPVHAFSSWG